MAFKVLDNLLNDASLLAAHTTMEIEYIPREMIIKNERNHYSIKNVADLAQDIKMGGLEQPVVVTENEDGTYKLLSGERRLTAIDLLAAQGEWEGDIPCIVKGLEEYDLPLPDDLKEDYAIMRTNGFTRVLNDSDILYQSEKWERIIEELRKAGYKGITVGKDENGEDIVQQISGKRTREIVAETLNVSTGQLHKFETVRKNAGEGILDAVKNERMDIAAANEAAGMPLEKQAELLGHTAEKEKVTTQDVKDFREREGLKKEPDEREIKEFYEYLVGTEHFPADGICKELLIEKLGKCFAELSTENLSFRCTPKDIQINKCDKITWTKMTKLMKPYMETEKIPAQKGGDGTDNIKPSEKREEGAGRAAREGDGEEGGRQKKRCYVEIFLEKEKSLLEEYEKIPDLPERTLIKQQIIVEALGMLASSLQKRE